MSIRPSRWPVRAAKDGLDAYVLSTEADRFGAARIASRFAAQAGLSPRREREFAIAVAELASNAVRHGGGGSVSFRTLAEPPGVSATIRDEGPGLADDRRAFLDGHSGGGRRVRDETRVTGSLGVGLGAVRRLSDEVRISTGPDCGTEITIVKYRSWFPPREA
jgi:serine/threonine-protein kinase RsbT